MFLYRWCHDHTVVHDDRLKELSKSKNEASIHDSYVFPKLYIDSLYSNESLCMHVLRLSFVMCRSVSTLGSSSCSLPQLDRRVLAGHSPTLVVMLRFSLSSLLSV